MVGKLALLTADELKALMAEAVQAGVTRALASQASVPSEMAEGEAAQYLGVAPATLRQWRCQKRGPVYHKSGRTVRYSRSDLERWIRSSRVLTIDEVSRETCG